MEIQRVKGFNDYTGEEAWKREKIKKIIQEQFELYGFEPAETPIIEYEEFVKEGNEQDEAVSDIFKLQDKGKRKLALRYELTFPLKRIARQKKLPYKRYQIGPVFRDEPVSSNRLRQFTQCDADIVGSSLKDEAEILGMAKKILDNLKIDFVIYVNNRKLLNEILKTAKIKDEDIEGVIREIDKMDKLPEKEVLNNLKKYNAEKLLNIFKKPEKEFEKYENFKEIKNLKKLAREYKVKLKFSPSLARGLSYYNGNVFEIKTNKEKYSIAGGGAYMFNDIQCFGISFGLERLTKLAKVEIDNTQFMVLSIKQDKEAIKIAEKLRENKKSVLLMLDKNISKALEYANSKNIEKVIFVGEQEVKNGKFKIRDMKTGKEKFFELRELANI